MAHSGQQEKVIARVISGGQTGVDRAALDAARALGVPVGGWCPRGGKAEDFPRPPGLTSVYPELRETPLADPSQRTRWNVRDSDATLILLPADADSPGTLLTRREAGRLGRPWLEVEPRDPAAAKAVRRFLHRNVPRVLNVAGPRESESPGVYPAALALLTRILT